MDDAPWFDTAIRRHCDEHGPSGGAWNISMVLERLHRAAPAALTPIVSGEELVERLRSTGTALFRPDHPAALLMWEAAARIQQDAVRIERLREALETVVAANSAARNMVPDEEEGLAAQVFCHYINAADVKAREALASIDVERSE